MFKVLSYSPSNFLCFPGGETEALKCAFELQAPLDDECSRMPPLEAQSSHPVDDKEPFLLPLTLNPNDRTISTGSTAASETSEWSTPLGQPASLSDVSSVLKDASVPLELPLAKNAILLEAVAIKSSNLRPSLLELLDAIRALSHACFDEDVTQLINKKTGWKLNLLVTQNETRLLGFLSYRVSVQSNSLEIAKVAVCKDCRRMGYGRRLVKNILLSAKKFGSSVHYVSLSSLPESISFYQRLGFKRHDDVKFTRATTNKNEEITPGQVYMEMRIRKAGGKGGGQKKKK